MGKSASRVRVEALALGRRVAALALGRKVGALGRGAGALALGLGVAALALGLGVGGCAGSPAVPGSGDAGAQDRPHVEVGFPCLTDDECLSLDDGVFCNGVPTCDDGLCRVVATPSCEDGVACTDGVCDLATDACVQVPNNDKCPAEYPICFLQYGCQLAQPCEHDSECDDGLFCNGTESCILGSCASSGAPDCDDLDACTTDACDEDLDQCTHAQLSLPTVYDRPDYDFLDANCDGIDGTITKSIFVAPPPIGSDANAGTMAAPVATILKGIQLATPAKFDVLIAKGTYAESVSLVSGVSLYGGYDASLGWSRGHHASGATTIVAPDTTAVIGQSLTEETHLELIEIRSATATAAGASSYGVRIVNSPGPVIVSDCMILAGNGGPGAAGGDGSTGGGGTVGGAASGIAQGGGGASPCGANGGAGAGGAYGETVGNTGANGTQVSGGGTAGPGGSGGGKGDCSTASSSNGEPAPPLNLDLSPGGPGGPGANGNPGTSFGALDGAGLYLSPPGGDGQSSGTPGGGGGGGGSGGGTAHGSSYWTGCTDCDAKVWSGAGGGGGGGGCGGTPGHGGGGGGGSFAIVVVNSTVTVDRCALASGTGGAGGSGGSGGHGGPGAAGGGPAGQQCDESDCSTKCGGAGHAGGQGGDGGHGGGAAGGSGGSSVCVVYKGTAPTTTGNTCANGGAGSGGQGGSNGAATAPGGTAGVTADVRAG